MNYALLRLVGKPNKHTEQPPSLMASQEDANEASINATGKAFSHTILLLKFMICTRDSATSCTTNHISHSLHT